MIPTIRVKPWSKDQGLFVVLNEEDFDPQRHELYVDEASAAVQAVEKARAEAERLATEEEAQRKAAEEEVARQAASIAALVAQQALDIGAQAAPAQEQSTGPVAVETTTAPEQPIAGTETAPASAPEPGTPDLTVAKGPRGLFFLKAGDTIVSKGFPTEEEAAAAVAELSSGGAQ
jgi:hypothetical protein